VQQQALVPRVRGQVRLLQQRPGDRQAGLGVAVLPGDPAEPQQPLRGDGGGAGVDRLVGINLKGPYFLTQQVALRMIEAGVAGKIVTISSMSAYTASVNRGDYCVTKAGLGMMTKLFAARLAEHGITVFEVRPGIIATDMTGPVQAKYDKLILEDGITPIRRWGTPGDVGRAVVAIATDLLPFSTGQVIDVDGGFHLRTL
jgi:NAD(P)-dependent dehydrogenase (short-subunit alcohol dehydrogenase family)